MLQITKAGRTSPDQNLSLYWLLTLREAMLRANVFDFEVPGRFAEPPAMPGEESFPTRNTSRLTRSPPVTSRCSKANTLKQSNIPRTYKTLMSTQNSS